MNYGQNSDDGKMKDVEPVKIIAKNTFRPHQRQYPLKTEAEEGIEPVRKDLATVGVIIPCPYSPCNTPLFPVKKAAPSQGWQMIQDLQAVNQAVMPRAPTVPDPHVLLNDLKQINFSLLWIW